MGTRVSLLAGTVGTGCIFAVVVDGCERGGDTCKLAVGTGCIFAVAGDGEQKHVPS